MKILDDDAVKAWEREMDAASNRIAELQAEVERLRDELRKRGEWHHPACRKMMYDIGSSPCTCELEFERGQFDLTNAIKRAEAAKVGQQDCDCKGVHKKYASLQAEVDRLRKEQADFEYNASQIINAAESRLTRLLEGLENLVKHDSLMTETMLGNAVSVGDVKALIKEARDGD